MLQTETRPELVVYVNREVCHQSELPLRESPLRFAILRKDGTTSNAWGVRVDRNGEVYVVCRDNMKELKISLHASGERHIAFTKESGLEMTDGSRFWNKWNELPLDGSKVMPSFHIFFPSWGIGLTEDMRNSNSRVWDTNQLFIDGVESPYRIAVSFCETDEHLRMNFPNQEENCALPLGVIPTSPGKKLWVVAQLGLEGKLRETAERALYHMDNSMPQSLKEESKGEILAACLSGKNDSGSAFILPAPLRVV